LITPLNLRADILYNDTINNWIRLFADPSEYNPIHNGEGSDLKPTAAGFFLSVGLVQRGFNLKLSYTETNIRVAIMKIARHHLMTASLATVVDYLSPELDDITQGYTIRQGIIKSPTDYKGTFAMDSSFSPEGFTFTFMEAKNYYV
jgi:hypothetical protein